MNEVKSSYHQLPQPDEVSSKERNDGMGAYLTMFATWAIGLPLPVINLIVALVYYAVNKHEGKFVRFHALHSLLAQIPVSLLNAGGIFWIIGCIVMKSTPNIYFLIYFLITVLVNIIYFIFSLIAASKARDGEYYYFVFFGKMAFDKVYKIQG